MFAIRWALVACFAMSASQALDGARGDLPWEVDLGSPVTGFPITLPSTAGST